MATTQIKGFKDQSRAQAKSANNTSTPSTRQLPDGSWVGVSDEVDRGGRKDRELYGDEGTAVWVSDMERDEAEQKRLREEAQNPQPRQSIAQPNAQPRAAEEPRPASYGAAESEARAKRDERTASADAAGEPVAHHNPDADHDAHGKKRKHG
jgi:hypothetical protein